MEGRPVVADTTLASVVPGVLASWTTLGLAVVGFGVVLALLSPRFGYAYEVADMPVLSATACLVAAGVVFSLGLPLLVRVSVSADARHVRILTVLIVAAGLAARLALFASEP